MTGGVLDTIVAGNLDEDEEARLSWPNVTRRTTASATAPPMSI
jgi:hypothetical protein